MRERVKGTKLQGKADVLCRGKSEVRGHEKDQGNLAEDKGTCEQT